MDEIDFEEIFLIDGMHFHEHFNRGFQNIIWWLLIAYNELKKHQQWTIFSWFEIFKPFLNCFNEEVYFAHLSKHIKEMINAFGDLALMDDAGDCTVLHNFVDQSRQEHKLLRL